MALTDPAPGATRGRIDQGVDWSGVTRVVAVLAGKITEINYNLAGWGTRIVERLTNGQYVYYALETSGTSPSVRVGQAVRAGQQLAGGGSGGVIEVGYLNPQTNEALGAPGYKEGQQTAAGQAFSKALSGGSTGTTPATGPAVWAVKVSLEAATSGSGWTELSTNGFAHGGSSCCDQNGNCHCDFATLGKEYPLGTMLRITNPANGKTGLWPMTDKGDGSSFAPAIGLTPAVSGFLGVKSGGTVQISLPTGNLQVASGFGTRVGGSAAPSGGPAGRTRPGGGTSSGSGGSTVSDPQAIKGYLGRYVQLRDQGRAAPADIQAMTVPNPGGTPIQASALWWLGAFRQSALRVFGGDPSS